VEPGQPGALIITCVDGRWYQYFNEFARVHLKAGPRTSSTTRRSRRNFTPLNGSNPEKVVFEAFHDWPSEIKNQESRIKNRVSRLGR